ncbi:hypothetical protein MOX02_58990 [Methylobacterium oxalidis]|uniref:Uncharacterized protein n=1 Tax=Methylobacterium oxalidis TaxID=944322 RepID=A0A512JD46_9HYPH|nr:hypothetical protein MOX02_58990 [Methylobacterium oxalidis]GLS65772.1 hypothetical protein GCM10007888_41540 [Methylobacterium oxalidis]
MKRGTRPSTYANPPSELRIKPSAFAQSSGEPRVIWDLRGTSKSHGYRVAASHSQVVDLKRPEDIIGPDSARPADTKPSPRPTQEVRAGEDDEQIVSPDMILED